MENIKLLTIQNRNKVILQPGGFYEIIIAHFGTYYVNMAGGVEKVTCNLANALVERGHEVTILYRDDKEGNPYFPLDKG